MLPAPRAAALAAAAALVLLVAPLAVRAVADSATPARPSLTVSPAPSPTHPFPAPAAAAPPAPAPSPAEQPAAPAPTPEEQIAWRASRAEGTPQAGRLIDAVLLPAEGSHFVTWDPIADVSPGAEDRRWGTDRLVRTLLDVLDDYAAAHPGAPKVVVGDLSHPQGGEIANHASHENGLDVDVYYPRLDRQVTVPGSASDIDPALSQDLVDRFVAAGATHVFVGPNTPLTGPAGVVQPLRLHDNHLHVRLPPG